jgi:hypothetical protein
MKSQMSRWLASLFLVFCSACGSAQVADELVSRCPPPDKEIQASCKETTYKDLPDGAKKLLRKLKCDTPPNPNYDYGSAVDLNGDGSPEFEFCCKAASHGPCGSVVVGKIGNQWKDLTAKEGVLGFDGACNGFIVLQSRNYGFHDLCLPAECAPGSRDSKNCLPMIWHFDGGRYRSAAPAHNPE